MLWLLSKCDRTVMRLAGQGFKGLPSSAASIWLEMQRRLEEAILASEKLHVQQG